MVESVRQIIRAAGLVVARAIGTRLVDYKTGHSLGRVLIIPWRGKIHLIGLSRPVRVAFLHQRRITYWKQEVGFTIHDPPDFEKLRPNSPKRTEEDEDQV